MHALTLSNNNYKLSRSTHKYAQVHITFILHYFFIERILPSERGEHHVAADNLPEDNITTEYADLNVHTSVAVG